MKIKDLMELFDLSFFQVKILLNEYADLEIERNNSANSEVYRENDTIIIKEDRECKYHFKIEEHGSCYTLNKIVFNERCSSIATIWFNDVFPDSNMLSKSKAYEIIQNIKKHLEEVE